MIFNAPSCTFFCFFLVFFSKKFCRFMETLYICPVHSDVVRDEE